MPSTPIPGFQPQGVAWQRGFSISHCLSPGKKPLWEPPVDFLATSVCQHCGNVNLDIRLRVPGSFPKHVLPSLHQFKYFSWNLHPWLREFNSYQDLA